MLLVFQSIIVYGLIIWVMAYFGKIAYKSQYPNGFDNKDMFYGKDMSLSSLLTKSYYLIPILVFSTFAALRYKVGTDCESYKYIYYEISQYGTSLRAQNIESGFISLVSLTNSLSDSHYIFMFVLAFLQIVPLYYAQRKATYSLVFFGLVLIFSGTYLSLMNGIRQNIAACFFVALLPFVLEKKKWAWYILGVILATTMHKSAYILFALGVLAYFLQYKIPNKYIQLALLATCFILMDKVQINSIAELFSIYGTEAGYDEGAINAYTNTEAMTKTFGFRSMLLLTTYIITICYNDKMKLYFNSKVFNMQYNLFFLGICLFLLFYNDFVIGRLLYYLKIFIPIITSTTLFYLWKNKSKNNRLMFKVMITILLIHFAYELYSGMQEFPNESVLYKFDIFRL